MSTAIPPNPNAIIRALLDIAQAAYVLIHSPSKEMGDNLRVQMALLEELPQYCNNPVNGPCRARKYLESFLVGGSTLTTIAADVQRDGIEFEAQVWKAPATGPGFTPTAEFPASGPIHHDFYTHRDAWRALIGRALIARSEKAEGDDGSYAEHELRAFDRAFDSLPPQHERRLRERTIEPAIPVVGKDALVEATRPLFVKAMQSQGHRADLNEQGMYKGVSEYRWEGWRAAVESMGFKPRVLEDWMRVLVFADMKERLALPSGDEGRIGADDVLDQLFEISQAAMQKDPGARVRGGEYMHSEFGRVLVIGNHPHDGAARICETYIDDEAYYFLCDRCALKPLDENVTWDHLGWDDERPVGAYKTAKQAMRDHLLAETADEALRIINDADLLKNLVEIFTMRDPGTTVKIYESSRENAATPWCLNVHEEGQVARHYRSTSLHQVIVVAHKGEQDREYPEPPL